MGAQRPLGRPMANTSTPSLSEPCQDKAGGISPSVCRINPNEGKGGNLTVKSGQKHNKHSHERSSPSSRDDEEENKHKLHEPCRIRSQLYVQSFGLKTFRAGHDPLISRTKEGCCGFLPFSFFSPFKVGVRKKSHILLPGQVSALVANSKTPQHFNYSTSQLFLAFYLDS